jgi:hypothetical protein
MKKIISILVIFLLFSCNEIKEISYKNKKQSTWTVSEINYESETTATYFAKSTDSTELNEDNTWFADTIGAFKVGDTLRFAKNNIR